MKRIRPMVACYVCEPKKRLEIHAFMADVHCDFKFSSQTFKVQPYVLQERGPYLYRQLHVRETPSVYVTSRDNWTSS
jgi:hypothetical protein